MKATLRPRIVIALGSLALLMALAALLAVVTHASLHADIDRVADAERDTHAALVLAATARDLYAHQAHTIILNDTSHLGHLGDVERELATLVTALRGFIGESDLRPEVEAIARSIDALREHFTTAIVPRVGGPREALIAPHDQALALVDGITMATDRLTAELRGRALSARAHADAQTARETIGMVSFAVLATLFALVAGIYLTRLARTERLAVVGELASAVAHEVNNPLTAMLGHARLLQRSADPDVASGATAIAAEAERCQAIVAGLRDLTRPHHLQRVAVDLRDLIDEVVEGLHASGPTTPIVVEGQATIVGDGPKLRQIMWNLLKNAAEAHPTKVSVSLQATPERVRVRVEDDGPGIAAAVRERLFEPFVTSKPEGTGLGLAVSAALARAHGGTLRLLPSSAGAVFELELPKEERT